MLDLPDVGRYGHILPHVIYRMTVRSIDEALLFLAQAELFDYRLANCGLVGLLALLLVADGSDNRHNYAGAAHGGRGIFGHAVHLNGARVQLLQRHSHFQLVHQVVAILDRYVLRLQSVPMRLFTLSLLL